MSLFSMVSTSRWTSSRLWKGSLRGGTRIGCVSPIECSTLVKCPKSLDPLETTLLSRASMSYTRSFSLSEIDGLCHFSHNLLQILGLRGHTMCSCTFWLDRWFWITRYDVPVGVSSSSSSKSEHSCPMVLPRYILRGFACGLKILMGMVPSLTVATTYKIPVEYHSSNRFSSSRTPVILSITLPPSTLPMIFVNREFKQARTQQQ